MNVMIRMLLPLGLVVFGAVAAFMGFVVLATSLSSGEITTGVAATASRPASQRTMTRAADPGAYWRAVGLLGLLPAAGGIAAVLAGRRMLRGRPDDAE